MGNERNNFMASIATTVADYRNGEISSLTSEHIEKWVNQFDDVVQLPILAELDHVLKQTYISKKSFSTFLENLVTNPKLTEGDPKAFWEKVTFLNIQQGGNSQKEMLKIFGEFLEVKLNVKLKCFNRKNAIPDFDEPYEGPKTSKNLYRFDIDFENLVTDTDVSDMASDAFIYLDDAVFTGNRVRNDLMAWIKNDAPPKAHIHIIVMAFFLGGQYYANKGINEAAKAAGKNINITWWRCIEFEDRKSYTNSSDVLRPSKLPNDQLTQAYIDKLTKAGYPPNLRQPGNPGKLFSSKEGRYILEQEFLKKGAFIRNECKNLNEYQRPLGNILLKTLGFGALFVTFRNCPNNCPLVFWANDPWYPLFRRKTN